ncbi:MAG TPA: 6-bladed beta-propeller [Niabella sp.]|nr:6-bladed beta-propeller [Niabella sp.]
MKQLLFVSLIVAGTFVYGQAPYDEVQKLRFDPQQALGGDVSDLIDSVQYIPLETTKESTFGFISNLQVNSRYFVFFDSDTKAIYIFNNEGKFIGKVNKLPADIGWDKSDFYPLSQFTFNKSTDDIYIVFNDKGKGKKWLLQFNVKGVCIDKTDFTKTGGRFTDRFAILDNGSFLFSDHLFSPLSDKQTYFYKLKRFNSHGEGVMPLLKNDIFISRNAGKGYTLSNYSGNISVWTREFDYSFLVFDSDKICKYDIILPARMSLDSSKYRAPDFFNKIETVWEYARENKIVERLSAIGLSDNLLAFKKLSGTSSSMRDNFILSLQSKNFYSFDHITSDEKSYFLPIGSVEISAFENGIIYNEVASFEMFNAAEERPDKPWKENAVLNAYFATQNRKSNPLIVALKLKSGL